MIDGLNYIKNFISDDEQKSLIETIDSLPWCLDLKRRTQHFGYKYNYTKRDIGDSYLGELPEFLRSLCKKLADLKLFEIAPNQVIVNEYLPGQGIAPHIDLSKRFGATVASLSLLSECPMSFHFQKLVEEQILQPKSLIVLNGAARYVWQHGIDGKKIKERRVSITFRNVIE